MADSTALAYAKLVTRDPALPLATLLDDHALASWLAPAGARATVRRRYLRYKPGASCVVLAEMIHHGAPAWVTVTGVAAASRAKTTKALAHARLDEVVAAEQHAGLVAVLPAADRHLHGLRRLLREPDTVMSRLLNHDVEVRSVSPLAYKPHRRWVGRVELDDGDSVLVRAYRAGRAGPHVADLRALRAADAPVPEMIGNQERRDLVALSWVPGEVLDDVVGDRLSSATRAAVGSAGVALARLHVSRHVQAGEPWRPDTLGTAAHAVGVAVPTLAGAAARLAAGIVDEMRPSSAVLAHGDFSLDQVVLSDRGPHLLDLDRLGAAPAALDLATATAAMLADPARAHLAGPVLEALLTGYADVAPVPRPRELEVHVAAALLMRAVEPFRRCRPDWPVLVARSLGHAHDVLSHGLDATIERIPA